ncbi:hypothetical protein [Cystobacter fuscus]|uniref:hypothetical protein n=1 Tax=Cystobacter fuscus TaxID=43 RepID=UPI0037C08CB1
MSRLSKCRNEGPVLLARLLQRLPRGGMPQRPRAPLEVLGPGMRVLRPPDGGATFQVELPAPALARV